MGESSALINSPEPHADTEQNIAVAGPATIGRATAVSRP